MVPVGRAVGLAIVLACALPAAALQAQEPAAQEAGEIDVFMKALPYDRRFPERCQGKLIVGVLALAGDDANQAEAGRWEGLLRGALQKHFGGVPTELKVLPVRSAREAELLTADRAYDLLFLGHGLGEFVPGLAAMAERRHVLLVALDPAYVAAGAAIGYDSRARPAAILSNPSAARSQGSKFQQSFLRLTRQAGPPIQAEAERPARRLFQQQQIALARRSAGQAPEYPPNALRRNREATLVAEILIDAEGVIRHTTFLKTDPLFEGGVTEALRSWRFKPFLVDGAPVETVAVLKFDFKLNSKGSGR